MDNLRKNMLLKKKNDRADEKGNENPETKESSDTGIIQLFRVLAMEDEPEHAQGNSHGSGKSPYDLIISNSRPLTGYELNYLHGRGIMLYDSYVYGGEVHTVQSIEKALREGMDIQEINRMNENIDNNQMFLMEKKNREALGELANMPAYSIPYRQIRKIAALNNRIWGL